MGSRRVKRSRLSREAYLRRRIDGCLPTDMPPDYYAMMKELYRIGNNLNQIAAKAHVLNVIDVQRNDGAVKEFKRVVMDITNAVLLPQKVQKS